MEKVDRPLGPVVVDIAGTSLTDEEVKILQNPSTMKGEEFSALEKNSRRFRRLVL